MLESMRRLITDIGLGEFSESELKLHHEVLCRRIDIGLRRTEPPTQGDDGLLAIRTGISIATRTDWEKVLPGSEVLVCAFGGTHWVVAHATKDEGGGISVVEIIDRLILARRHTFNGFVQLMAELIIEASIRGNITHISTVAISLAFTTTNEIKDYGVEGELTSAVLSKGWEISDWATNADRHLGKPLIEYINQSGVLQVDLVALVIDTCAVAFDINSAADYVEKGAAILPMGFVCGTGTNACLAYRSEMVNLEVGEAPCSRDPIMEEMIARGLIPSSPILEYHTGMFIPYRLGIAVELLGERGFIPDSKAIEEAVLASDGALLSRFASGDLSARDLGDLWNLPVETDATSILRSLTQLALQKAGQVYGLILASVVQQARKEVGVSSTEDIVLTEGSVIHKGYEVKNVAERTCECLGQPHVRIVKSSGLAGVGVLAMVLRSCGIFKSVN